MEEFIIIHYNIASNKLIGLQTVCHSPSQYSFDHEEECFIKYHSTHKLNGKVLINEFNPTLYQYNYECNVHIFAIKQIKMTDRKCCVWIDKDNNM